MAKGSRRPLTTSRSERLLSSYATTAAGHHPSGGASELHEEDVWSTLHDGYDHHHDRSAWNTRARGNRDRELGGLSLAFDESFRGQNDRAAVASGGQSQRRSIATSAPMNVPDWGKILRVSSMGSLHEMSDDNGDDDSEEMVPPHEYLAREYARNRKMEGASMVEGVGRTLKGRDMRRVRDAVWSQTGFYG
ncbi:hypothetical protein LINPERPRIM_LOCUS33919 [Linum perenne]